MRRPAILLLFAILLPALPAVAGETRFRTFALIVDAGAEYLAAWQVELIYDPSRVRIVGVEGGAVPWREAPYYDPKGLDAGRMVVASFSLDPQLLSEAIRVARIHVHEIGRNRIPLQVTLVAAAAADGRRIGARVRLVPEEGDRP